MLSCNSFESLTIVNPKRYAGDSSTEDTRLFPYYAGYSVAFAKQLLSSYSTSLSKKVLDPWNGSGTTTQAASDLGMAAFGFDLNPVMILAAKASLISTHDVTSLIPLAQSLVEQTSSDSNFQIDLDDPLCKWISPSSAASVRQLENEINRTLISHEEYVNLTESLVLGHISSLAAFFYVCLFRAVRRILVSFIPTNPTWVKTPRHTSERKRPSSNTIHQSFLDEVQSLATNLQKTEGRKLDIENHATIHLGDATQLPLENESIDIVITSPPYCTRIDYAMATAIELSVLRVDALRFTNLRRSLMGTSTVELTARPVDSNWGETCENFLDAVYQHPSKASDSYYFKNHVQYFSSLYESVKEIGRVTKAKGTAILVVQDSFYKDVHNNVPLIVTEMAESVDLIIRRRSDFPANRSMVGRNRHARSYLKSRCNFESVLCFERV